MHDRPRNAHVAALAFLLVLAASRSQAAGFAPPRASGVETFLRLHNPTATFARGLVRSDSGSIGVEIDPGAVIDIPVAHSIELESATPLLSTWRLVGQDSETQLLAFGPRPDADACGEPVRVLVAGTACRFGTAGALVEEIAGATYRWTIEGGAILSGEGTASPVFSFGAGSAAVLRVEIAASGCTRTGAATIALRAPFEIVSLTSAPATANSPVSISWTYRDNESPRTQRLSIAGARVAVPLAARTYTFTPATAGAIEVALEASLIGGRRRAVAFPGPHIPSPSACSSDRHSLLIDVRPACTLPEGSIAVSGPTSFCEGGSVTLTAPEGTSYEWNTGAQSRSITVSSSGSYEVRVANGAGCDRAFGPIHVNETRRPAISLALSPSTIEVGGEATLTVTCQRCAGGSVGSSRGVSSLTNGGAFSGSGTFTFTFKESEGPATLAFTATGLPQLPCGQAATDQKTLVIATPVPTITAFSVNPSSIGRFGFGAGSCSEACATTSVSFTTKNTTSWSVDTASYLSGWRQDPALSHATIGTSQLFSNPDGSGSPRWIGSGDGSFSKNLLAFLPCSDEIIVTATGPGGTARATLPLRVAGCIIAFHREDFQGGSNTITVPMGATVTLRFTYIGPDASTLSATSTLGHALTPASRAVPQNHGIYSFSYTRSIAGDDTLSITSSACGATTAVQVK